ncbi:MAG: DUF2059 domain-containing protein [Deltaproteobacteria bacterium]|nr:DUF2059 domain-containing protein [Deltaproteobacteria bacterium]
MKKILLALIVCTLVFGFSGESQAKEDKISKKKRTLIEKIVNIGNPGLAAKSYKDGYSKMYTDVLTKDEAYKGKVDIDAVINVVHNTVNDGFTEYYEKIVTLYDEAFTIEELKTIDEFYRSKAGKKTIETMPGLSKEIMNFGREWGKALGPKIEAELLKKEGYKIKK